MTNSFYLKLLYLLAGAISVFAFAPLNYWYCIIISYIVWIKILNGQNSKHLLINCYIFGFGYFFTNLYWTFICLHQVINLNILISLIIYTTFTLFLAIYLVVAGILYLSLRVTTPKLQLINYILFMPSCWLIAEMLRSKLLSGFPWYNLGYTAINNPLLKGFFPIGGEYLTTWLLLSIIGAIYSLFKQIHKNYLIIIGCYIIAILSLGYSLHNIQYTVNTNKTISVALIQGNNSVAEKWNNSYFHLLLNKYAQMIATAKSADLIILPETAIAVFPQLLPSHYLQDLQKLAPKSQIIIGMPMPITKSKPQGYTNSALLINNFSYYNKQHLVPYGEYIPLKKLLGDFYQQVSLPMVNFQTGHNHSSNLNINNINIAFNLCYENGFSQELLTNNQKAQVIVNLSDMIWYKNTWAKDHHLQMSIARSLENQKYWLQDTNSGDTAIISPQGKVVASLLSNHQDILFYKVPIINGSTPYQKYGNLIIYSVLLVVIGIRLIILTKLFT